MPEDDIPESATPPSGPEDRLGPGQRRRALARMASEEFDVVVIGGGATGTGAALDAATRGLSVALLEARDYAAGTSSRSSKLIHGGLRYLEQRDFTLVREALRERGLLLKTLAPHLVRPVPFLFPLDKHWERPYIGAGMVLYDTLGGGHQGVPGHRHLSKRKALRLAPSLREDSMVGAFQYYDAQVDDARHTVTVVRTAAHFGAVVANNIAVEGFLREGERVTGVEARDAHTGDTLKVRAKAVINATGVWTDDIQAMVGERGKFHVRASKGVHLVVARDRLQLDTGLILRTEKSVLFVIPWGRHWIVGTTDTDWELDRAHPAASSSDIDYIFEHINKVLRDPLTHDDVEGVYAGLRPLLSEESDSTSTLSREHSVATPVPGLVAIAGGKYTTYRVMGKDARQPLGCRSTGSSASSAAPRPTRSACGPRRGSSGRWGSAASSPSTMRTASSGSVPGMLPTPVASTAAGTVASPTTGAALTPRVGAGRPVHRPDDARRWHVAPRSGERARASRSRARGRRRPLTVVPVPRAAAQLVRRRSGQAARAATRGPTRAARRARRAGRWPSGRRGSSA